MVEKTYVKKIRDNKKKSVIVFIHGFGGDPGVTWGNFPKFLIASPELAEWDVFSLGYSTKLAPDFKGIWSGDPSIQAIADYLYTQAFVGVLDQYEALVFVAHSMGGLVVQRALLDREALLDRTSHVFLFGTPSNGLKKAGWVDWFKRQTSDMAADGTFIRQLRDDWEQLWPKPLPPKLWVIAGDSDEFVPDSSALDPFPKDQRLVVPGNHLEIVKPEKADNLSVLAVIRGIQGEAAPAGPWNSARVALQMLDFREAVDKFEAHFDELDDAHLVELAIALDGLGESARALEIMEKAGKRGTDACGVLAGRLKRRWITEGRKDDHKRALELYQSSHLEAAEHGHFEQAFYHGINCCFLLLKEQDGKEQVREIAESVIEYCAKAPDTFWGLGTRGEANFYLGNIDAALSDYRAAVNTQPVAEPWQLKSMHSQACQLAAIMGRENLIEVLDTIFRQ